MAAYWNHLRTTEWVENRVFAYEMTSSSYFKSYTERWAIEETEDGCRFSFDDELVFPHGPLGKVMGWFGERMARDSSQKILRNPSVWPRPVTERPESGQAHSS